MLGARTEIRGTSVASTAASVAGKCRASAAGWPLSHNCSVLHSGLSWRPWKSLRGARGVGDEVRRNSSCPAACALRNSSRICVVASSIAVAQAKPPRVVEAALLEPRMIRNWSGAAAAGSPARAQQQVERQLEARRPLAFGEARGGKPSFKMGEEQGLGMGDPGERAIDHGPHGFGQRGGGRRRGQRRLVERRCRAMVVGGGEQVALADAARRCCAARARAGRRVRRDRTAPRGQAP